VDSSERETRLSVQFCKPAFAASGQIELPRASLGSNKDRRGDRLCRYERLRQRLIVRKYCATFPEGRQFPIFTLFAFLSSRTSGIPRASRAIRAAKARLSRIVASSLSTQCRATTHSFSNRSSRSAISKVRSFETIAFQSTFEFGSTFGRYSESRYREFQLWLRCNVT